MDRIKKLKIKKQDGTFSDYIPIGADAENIDTADGESVQLKLNKKPYYYNSVADMKADTKLKVGDMAITLGYYEANDGGGAEYNIISSSENIIDDKGSHHQLDNGLWAELIIKNKTILLKQFGLRVTDEDIGTDFQKIIDFAKTKYTIIVDDIYNLKTTIHINGPIRIIGQLSNYENFGLCGFLLTGDIVFFSLEEGCVNSLFERLIFKGSKTYSQGYEGIGIRFSSRDEQYAQYRNWKNEFKSCRFTRLKMALHFYGEGNIANYDYSSEMAFNFCKFYNNLTVAKWDNKQSYNINFLNSDLENEISGKGFILSACGGINVYGASISLKDSFISLLKNDNLSPTATYTECINVSNCRFEIYHETVLDYRLLDVSYPGSAPGGDNNHNLHVNNCDFFLHYDDSTLLNTNVRGLHAFLTNINFENSYTTAIVYNSSKNITEWSRIYIHTSTPDQISILNNVGQYSPWILMNGTVYSCCTNSEYNNNHLYYDNKILFGFSKSTITMPFSINIPWEYRKFKIQINGAFIGNSGTITITNSDGTFTETYTKSSNVLSSNEATIFLPYKENGDTYTITPTNIWGSCYIEK